MTADYLICEITNELLVTPLLNVTLPLSPSLSLRTVEILRYHVCCGIMQFYLYTSRAVQNTENQVGFAFPKAELIIIIIIIKYLKSVQTFFPTVTACNL